jgi:hypothetical protein
MRVRFGPIALPRGLRRGQSRELADAEVAALLRTLDLPAADRRARPAPPRRRAA